MSNKVTAVRRNGYGIVEQVRLDDGRVVDKRQAISMAKSGQLVGVCVGKTRSGAECLRGNPTDTPLVSMPNF